MKGKSLLKKVILLFVIVFTSALITHAQESVIAKPQGKPVALIFSNFHKNFSGGNKSSAFEITRAYLGYEYNFNSEWYGYVVMDVGDPKAGDHQFSAFLKNAYIRYTKSDLTFLFGMVPTTQFKVEEDIWGYRYIEEVFQDLYGFSSSADLGFTVRYRFADFISADVSVFNGEGYHNIQQDDHLRPAIGITLNPVPALTARLYADYMGDEVKQTSWSGFLSYEDNTLTAAGGYNYQENVDMVNGQDMYGPSFFATWVPMRNIKVFGRFDQINSSVPDGGNEPWQLESDGKLFMTGVEYAPLKGVRFAPNYRLWNPEMEGVASMHSIFLNCEVRF